MQVRKLTRGSNVNISPTASFANAPNITMGSHINIGAGSCLWAGNGTATITLKDQVVLAPNVMITTSNYRFNDPVPITQAPMKEADIVIGNDVWIGYGAVVLAGAQIGDGAIIGAGAVVRGTAPDCAILVSAEPSIIGYREPRG